MKQKIKEFAGQHVKMTHKEIAEHFSQQLKANISRQVIGNILKSEFKNAENHVDNGKKKKIMPLRSQNLEKALIQWIEMANNASMPVTDAIIKEKSIKFAESLCLNDFKATNGWLYKFKKRNSFKSYAISGEAKDILPENLESYRDNLKNQLKSYSLKDIYNVDETGLFYRLSPSRTIATGPQNGNKKSKERITVLLCANADGSDKRKPLVIGKYLKPRCFKNFNVQSIVNYKANGNAWMISSEFTNFLKDLDADMRMKKRKVALILDNAPSHKFVETSNIQLIFLPPNMTAKLQPLDAGIIKAFKSQYRKKQLEYLLHIFECNNNENHGDIFKKITLKDAILFIRYAWDIISHETINNCWSNTAIIPTKQNSIISVNNDIANINEIQNLIDVIVPNNAYSASEFINIEDENNVHGELIDEEIMKLFNNDDEILTDINVPKENLGCESEEEMVHRVTIKEAKTAFNEIQNFIFQSENVDTNVWNALKIIENKITENSTKYSTTKLDFWLDSKNKN